MTPAGVLFDLDGAVAGTAEELLAVGPIEVVHGIPELRELLLRR